MVWFGSLDGWIGLCGCLISWVVLLVSRLIGWVVWLVSRLVWCGWLVGLLLFVRMDGLVWFGWFGWMVGWLVDLVWMDGWLGGLVGCSLACFVWLVQSLSSVSTVNRRRPHSNRQCT